MRGNGDDGSMRCSRAACDATAALALHRNRGFVEAGRLTAVGFKHKRWLDTVLLQRTLNRGGR